MRRATPAARSAENGLRVYDEFQTLADFRAKRQRSGRAG